MRSAEDAVSLMRCTENDLAQLKLAACAGSSKSICDHLDFAKALRLAAPAEFSSMGRRVASDEIANAQKEAQRQLARRTSRHGPDCSRFLAASHDIRLVLAAAWSRGLFVAQQRNLAYEAELKQIVRRNDAAPSILNKRLIGLLHRSEFDATASISKSRNTAIRLARFTDFSRWFAESH